VGSRRFPLAALVVRGTWRDDDFESLESVEPFAFFADDDDWRENPAVEEGDGRSLGIRLTWERRDDPKFPTRGLWADGQLEHWGFGDDFEFTASGQVRAHADPDDYRLVVALRARAGRLGAGDTLAPQFLYRSRGSTIPGYEALSPSLTGDRMAFATATVHQALLGEKTRLYLVGIASVGDAWHPDEDAELNAGYGGGLAIHGMVRYAGIFGVYGVEEETWRVYTRLTPWL
jgi:outer membrane protein assembly factor BamA